MNIFSLADTDQILQGLREPSWKISIPVKTLTTTDNTKWWRKIHTKDHNKFAGYKIDGIVPIYKQNDAKGFNN